MVYGRDSRGIRTVPFSFRSVSCTCFVCAGPPSHTVRLNPRGRPANEYVGVTPYRIRPRYPSSTDGRGRNAIIDVRAGGGPLPSLDTGFEAFDPA